MATPKDRDEDVTGSPDYRQEDLEYFARQLRKSGLYEVTSTPKSYGPDHRHDFDGSYVPLNNNTRDTSKTGTRPKLLQTGDYDQQSSHAKIRQVRFLPTPGHSLLTNQTLKGKFDYIHPRIPDLPTFTGEEKAKTNLFEV